MKALILAAGRGTRVRPITYQMPKPMVPVLNKPVMEVLIGLLAGHGFRKIMVNTSYLADAIERYFRDGSRLGVEIGYSFEGHVEGGRIIDEPLGSAGAIRRIQEHAGFFDETFVVVCGDAILDTDISELVRFHKEHQALATVALSPVPERDVPNYGVALLNDEGRVQAFQEKPAVADAKSTLANAGIYVFEPEIVDWIPSGVPSDIGSELFTSLLSKNAAFYGKALPVSWLDIGRIEDYYRVSQLALLGEVPGISMPGTEIVPGIHVGINVRVDLSLCDVRPPVYIGSSSRIEPGCTVIGPTMVGSGCIVESGASVARSVVFDYTRIGSCAAIKDMIVSGSYCTDAEGTTIGVETCGVQWAVSDSRVRRSALKDLYRDSFLSAYLEPWEVHGPEPQIREAMIA